MKIMESERLILRVPTEDDFAALYAVHADPATNLYNPGWKKPTEEEFMESLKKIIEHHDKYGFGYYSLVDKDDNKVFGLCGLRHTSIRGEEYLNLYYRIATSKTRQGFVKEAAGKIIESVLKETDNKYRIVALTLKDNIASRKTAESLGLVYNEQFDDIDGEGNVYYFN